MGSLFSKNVSQQTVTLLKQTQIKLIFGGLITISGEVF